jgi:hypothetical protein
MSSYENRPSLYEIRCENGEIDEDAWRYEPVDYGDFYMIESYKYSNTFPKEWAQNHLEGTGPEQCGNCYDHGSRDGVFSGYCLNCADYDYNGERGPGLDTFNGTLEIEDDCALCTRGDPDQAGDDSTPASEKKYIQSPVLTPILCHACADVVTEFHEKSISGYVYQYCCQECVDIDFTTCSNCGDTEVSKNDCTDGSYGCCIQYLGGNPQYYCCGRCEGEDTTAFILSFRKNK